MVPIPTSARAAMSAVEIFRPCSAIAWRVAANSRSRLRLESARSLISGLGGPSRAMAVPGGRAPTHSPSAPASPSTELSTPYGVYSTHVRYFGHAHYDRDQRAVGASAGKDIGRSNAT